MHLDFFWSEQITWYEKSSVGIKESVHQSFIACSMSMSEGKRTTILLALIFSAYRIDNSVFPVPQGITQVARSGAISLLLCGKLIRSWRAFSWMGHNGLGFGWENLPFSMKSLILIKSSWVKLLKKSISILRTLFFFSMTSWASFDKPVVRKIILWSANSETLKKVLNSVCVKFAFLRYLAWKTTLVPSVCMKRPSCPRSSWVSLASLTSLVGISCPR